MKLPFLVLQMAGVAAYVDMCPGSGSSVHPKTTMEVAFEVDSCASVKAEMKARIERGAAYEITADEDAPTDADVQGARTTLEVDYASDYKIGIYFKPTNIDFREKSTAHPPGCVITACGEGQSRSYDDDSTIYCGLHNLYAKDSLVLQSFDYKETVLSTLHSSTDEKTCAAAAWAHRTFGFH